MKYGLMQKLRLTGLQERTDRWPRATVGYLEDGKPGTRDPITFQRFLCSSNRINFAASHIFRYQNLTRRNLNFWYSQVLFFMATLYQTPKFCSLLNNSFRVLGNRLPSFMYNCSQVTIILICVFLGSTEGQADELKGMKE